ncbi:hypothetical protein [Acidianus sp. HS-5]|uniref:hypothetical protein n=1 Tax=Acidianus sp. HS-5 TaxID=2886040 RepID=UPI001F31962E|nr:hypothetical protein [Acidianus sp. HS-5]BDC17953.1 hypothetical protein HS5_08430 [Acidianus sp. HS-5]
MMRSRNYQIFSIIFKERFREPTLEIVIPIMLSSNVFINAFYERGNFTIYGIMLAFIPLISVSETIVFSLALRNIIFVTGDHIYRGSIISFLTFPIKRISLFLMMYFSDVIIPYILWLTTTEAFILFSGIPVPQFLVLIYTVGYFFVEDIILSVALTFRSAGISTLLSSFIVGTLFIFGGMLNYYEIIQGYHGLCITSALNPYVLLLYEAVSQKSLPCLFGGIIIELVIALLTFVFSLNKFKRMEI